MLCQRLAGAHLAGHGHHHVHHHHHHHRHHDHHPHHHYQHDHHHINAITIRIHQREMDSDARKDIVVNHVHPGYVDTDMTRFANLVTLFKIESIVTHFLKMKSVVTHFAQPQGAADH